MKQTDYVVFLATMEVSTPVQNGLARLELQVNLIFVEFISRTVSIFW